MKSLLANLMAVGLAAAACWVDLRIGDLALMMIMAMAFPFLLALIWPKQFWMWSLVIFLPLPIILSIKRFAFGEHFEPNYIATWITVLPALVGGVAGYAFRRIVRAIREEQAVGKK